MGKLAIAGYVLLLYGFIFLPVAVLVLFSFQDGRFPIPPFNGPSLKWYAAVFADGKLTDALINSLLVAVLSSALGLCARVYRRLRSGPLPAALCLTAAGAAYRAADGQLFDHRSGAVDDLQRARRVAFAVDRRRWPCGDQPTVVFRHHLRPDGRPPDQHRARRA